MTENQTLVPMGRGGKREGAGRRGILKSILADPKFAQARGINPLYASEILGHVVDERRAWQRVFNSEDDRIILQALMFLVSMRDGKPAQRINVTSTNLQLNASDLERARAIVAEIRQDSSESTPRLGPMVQGELVQEDGGRDGEDVADSTAKKNESQHNASEG